MAVLKMTEKHKAMAYVLNREFHYSMVKIGDLMGVSQSTISSSIKDFEYQLVIKNLENELNEARTELYKRGIQLPTIDLNIQNNEFKELM